MNTKKDTTFSAILLLLVSLVAASCGGSDTGSGANPPDTTLNRPAPDNNSATNSSLADTAFSKDSTGKIPDTTHRR